MVLEMTAIPQQVAHSRIAQLKDEIMARGGSFLPQVNPFARAVALARASLPGRSRVQIRAAYLYELVKLAAIQIEPGWTLAGNHLPTAHSELYPPDPSLPEHQSLLQALGVRPFEAESVVQAVSQWKDARWAAVGESQGEEGRGVPGPNNDSTTVFWSIGWVENHSIRDYAKVLRTGFRGIRREVEDQLGAADVAAPDYARQENFWKAALSICDAGILLGQRYAGLAGDQAQACPPGEERQRLEAIRETCARVPAEGARTFREAVQSLWLAHILTCGEDGINANSLGRLDQILYPYYAEDLAAGRLTREEGLEILEELACRLYLGYDVQAITLGGSDAQGQDAVNELSYLFLEATRSVELVRDLSVRLSKNSPPAFVDLASQLIARGGGIPFIFNDDCFIEALSERGIALEDARNYSPIGCIELTIPGRANPHAVSGEFCSTKCLELALFDGQDPLTGLQVGPHTGTLTSFAGFEDLYRAYCQQVEFFARRMVYHINRAELAQREGGPLPCLSVLTDDCIARGRDITDEGVVYNYHSICFIGTPTTADALQALKKIVFEEKSASSAEILEALRANWQGQEGLRQKMLTRAPKYGNDQPEVDGLAARVAEDFIHLMDGMRSPLNGRFVVHLFSFVWHLDFGRIIGATPDGRRASEPLAYSLAAQQGRDVKGITALLRSIARLPHRQAAGGTAAIVEIDPQLVAGEEGPALLAQLITTAIHMGVGQLQWNVVTAERLIQAQQDPEHYGNIPVRVAGYSQMFKLVDKQLQDHIIARTKHRS
jgi:pyruvate-formate lyase